MGFGCAESPKSPLLGQNWRLLACLAGKLELLSEKTNAHSQPITSVAFSPDGTKIVSAGSAEKTFKVWDLSATIKVWDSGAPEPSKSPLLGQNWRLLGFPADALGLLSEKTDAHSDRITSVAFSPDGTKIVSGSYDKTIKVWDSGAPRALKLPFLGQNWRLLACLADKLELLSEKTNAHSVSHGRRAKRGEKESKRHHGSTQQQIQSTTYPLIPHREFPTVVTD
jgi:WD40 repeat protein